MTEKEFTTLKVGDKIIVHNTIEDSCDGGHIHNDEIATILKFNPSSPFLISFRFVNFPLNCSHEFNEKRGDGKDTLQILVKKSVIEQENDKLIDKKKINIEIFRKNGKTIFKFEIDPRIEALFKGIAEEEKESTGWKGLKFYSCPDLTKEENYKNKLYNMRLFDDFGTGLIRKNTLNIAWIRAVGGKGEIEVKDPISFSELSLLFRNATQFIKEHFEDNFKNFTIKGSLSVEI